MLAFERPTIRGSHDATYGHDRSQGDPLLVDGLGARWETLTTAFKAFPCHVTAQAPVQALLDLKRQHAAAGRRYALPLAGVDFYPVLRAGEPRALHCLGGGRGLHGR